MLATNANNLLNSVIKGVRTGVAELPEKAAATAAGATKAMEGAPKGTLTGAALGAGALAVGAGAVIKNLSGKAATELSHTKYLRGEVVGTGTVMKTARGLGGLRSFVHFAGIGANALGVASKIPLAGKVFGAGAALLGAPEHLMKKNVVEAFGDAANLAKKVPLVGGHVDGLAASAGKLMTGFAGRVDTHLGAAQMADSKGGFLAAPMAMLRGLSDKRLGKSMQQLDKLPAGLGEFESHAVQIQDVVKSLAQNKVALGGETTAKSLIEKIEGLVGEAGGKVASKQDKAQLGKLMQYAKAATGAVGAHDSHQTLLTPSRIIDNVKGMSVDEVVNHTARYSAYAVDAYQNVNAIRGGIRALKAITADVQGTQPNKVSTFKVLFGVNQPEIVRQARKQFFMGVMPGVISGGLGYLVSSQLTKRFGHTGMIGSMAGTMSFSAVAMLGNMVSSKNPMIDVYKAIKITQEQGQPVDREMIGKFLAAASPELAKLGGEHSTNTLLIAAYYAENNTPVAQMLADINGKRLGAIAHEMEQILNNRPVAKAAAPKQEVLGEHTARVVMGGRPTLQQAV